MALLLVKMFNKNRKKEDMKDLVFIVQAYEGRTPEMQLMDVCTLELFCKTSDEALKKAEELIKKEHYRVSQIIEKEA